MSEFIKNIWYVAAWGNEVDETTLLDRTIAGERILFFRSNGEITALQNRCCHRSAPLSLGRREGSGVRCGYHGLLFDTAGRCIEIPGQDVIPPKAYVNNYAVAERSGWVWVWPGDRALADPALIPSMRAMADPDWNIKSGVLHYDTNYQLLNDNLLDLSHVSYVHANTLGGTEAWADSVPQVKRTEQGFTFERWLTDVAVAPFLRSIIDESLRHDILNVYDFHMPGALTIEIIFDEHGKLSRQEMPAKGQRTVSWQAVTPETEHSSHYFFSAAADPRAPQIVLDTIFEGFGNAFEEDRLMISAQQALLDSDMGGQNISRVATAHDGPLLQVRRLIARAIAAEEANKPKRSASIVEAA